MRAVLAMVVIAVAALAAGGGGDSGRGSSPGGPSRDGEGGPRDVRIVSGTVDLRTGEGEIDSVTAVPDSRAPEGEPGPFRLEVRDADGDVLAGVDFGARALHDGSGSGDGTALFVVPVAEPGDDAEEIVVTRDGAEVATVSASDHPPTVEMTSPRPGAVLTGDEAMFTWVGDDPDGDALTYTVLYRADRADSWTTITAGSVGTRARVFLDEAGWESPGSVRVIASDGFHSRWASAEDITLG